METSLLHNARVYTLEGKAEPVAAIALSDGKVLAAGSLDTVRAAAGKGAREIDLDGATVLPGLIDTHPHLLHFGGFGEADVDLLDATSHADIVARIRARAETTPAGEWIVCTPVGEPHYFLRRSYKDLAEGRLPDRRVLDSATAAHPVFIQAWAPVTPNVCAFNSRALAELGITRDTPDRVANVWIEKDASGEPTGILTGSVNNYYSNDAFMNGLLCRVPAFHPERVVPGTLREMAKYNALGVTTVYEGHAMGPMEIEGWRALRAQDAMTVRVLMCPEAEPYGLPFLQPLAPEEFEANLEGALKQVDARDAMLRMDGVTISRGGPCWPGLLLMREPYKDPYGQPTRGVSFVSHERAERAMRFCAERGLRLNMVVAGDAEHDEYLASLEAVDREISTRREIPIRDRGWILQHAILMEEGHARRYAALGIDVTTSMSFSWGKGDLYAERIGEPVLRNLIPLKRLLRAGLTVACGTDWGPKNVFEHLALAVTHRFASGRANATPDHAVSREEALLMWTRDAARVLRWEGIGTLAPGNHADLIVVDRDPLTCPIEDLPATRVLATLLDGRAVHGEILTGSRSP